MDVQQLRCFLAVAHEGNFGRAAERLRLTTSPVSRAVKDLERELGGALFVRSYHHVELTPAGRHLLERVEPVVLDLDRIRVEVQQITDVTTRTLVIGGTHLAPRSVLNAVIDAAEAVDPGRPVDTVLATSADLLGSLASGAIQLAVVHLPVADPGLEVLPLVSYTVVAMLRSDDPLCERESIGVADLAEHTYVTMADSVQPATMERTRRALLARGITRIETVPAPDVLMIAAKVRRRGCFTFVPREGDVWRVYDDPDFGTVEVTDAPQIEIGLVWRQADTDRTAVAREVHARLEARRCAPG